jgi:hypothetical protein
MRSAIASDITRMVDMTLIVEARPVTSASASEDQPTGRRLL